MDKLKAWLRDHARAVVLGTSGTICAVGLIALGSGIAGSEPDEAARAQVAAELAVYQQRVDTAHAQWEEAHHQLQVNMDTLDLDRVSADRALGQQLLIQLGEDQLGRDLVLGPESDGDHSVLADFDVRVAGVSSLDYSYFGVAQIQTGENAEYWVMAYTTASNGEASDVVVAKASAQTAAQFNAPHEEKN